MSAWKGALAAALVLIAEEVLVTNRGGTAAVNGAAGVAVTAIDHFADPGVPAIPDLADKKAVAGPGQPNAGIVHQNQSAAEKSGAAIGGSGSVAAQPPGEVGPPPGYLGRA